MSGRRPAPRPAGLALGCLLAACLPRPPDASHPSQQLDPALVAVADAMDPGPGAPLLDDMPAWLKDDAQLHLAGRADLGRSTVDALHEARSALAAWNGAPQFGPRETLPELLVLAHGLVRAERALAAGARDPELLATLSAAYAELARTRHLRAAAARYLEQRTARVPGFARADFLQLREGQVFWDRALARAPALSRHLAARLFREAPRHPEVPGALRQLAALALYLGDDRGAVALFTLALERLPHPDGDDYAALAGLCFQALDASCGDRALREARSFGDEDGRLAGLAAAADDLQRLRALGPGPHALGPGLERAALLYALHRDDDCAAQLAALREAHPTDARPLVGLAALELERRGDFLAAAALHEPARTLQPRDRRYHEVFLAARLRAAIDAVALQLPPGDPAELAALADLLAGYRAIEPARAEALALGVDAAREALSRLSAGDRRGARAALAPVPADAFALAQRRPGAREAWLLVYATLPHAAHADEALAIATAPLPGAPDPELRLLQARALVDLALQWEQEGMLPAAEQALADLPAAVDADEALLLRATLDALRGRRGDAAALERASAAYRALAERRSGAERALPLSNLGALALAAGDAQTAVDAFTEAIRAAPGALAPQLNLAAAAYVAEGRPHPDLAPLLPRAAASPTPALSLHARAWQVAMTPEGPARAGLRAELRAALTRAQTEALRGHVALGRWSVAVEAPLAVDVHTHSGALVVDLAARPQAWLLVPAPDLEALLAPPARGKGRLSGKSAGAPL